MSQWYLSKDGQALGPLEEDKLITLIKEGDVKPVDLVYRAGATEWLPISQVHELASYFNQSNEDSEPVPKGDGQKDWVLLKKVKTDKGREYKQIGPFSMDHVFELVDAGEIRFTDFAWKQGMDTWAKISDIPEFSMPLPSSPKVDTSIYEKTNVDIEDNTVTDAKQKASLTHLVSIERFDHEKTMVQPSSSSPSPDQPPSASPQEDDLIPLNTGDLEIPPDLDKTEISAVSPINSEEFVTESGAGLDEDDSDAGISLWSLEPPSGKKSEAHEASGDEATRVASVEAVEPVATKKAKPKKKEKPKKKTKNKEPRENPLANVSAETWQWVAAVGAVVLGFFFFAMSFSVDSQEVVYDADSELGRQLQAQKAQSGQPFQPEEIPQKMETYKKAIENARVAPAPNPQLENRSRLPKELARKMIPSNPPKPSPKVPLIEKVTKKRLPKEGSQVAPVKPVQVAKKVVPQKKVAPPRQLAATKKQKIAKQIALMKKTKRKARKTVIKKNKPVAVKRKVVKTSTAPRVARPAGGKKSKSFYQQRDRLALFYSSLKAETLSVDIAREYKKLKNNKRAWANFYGNWRGKVRRSLAQDIRQFPKRNEKYAYPKIMANFKKDYNLIYKYGETFDSKVKGSRAPSGAPSNMLGVFSRYKKQAQSLGR